ncbi:hypothetical protein [Pseudomonas sp.]|uniref:hypothetical protein n=1 Tax=Pseudomonas sp. TaxID=306 RepID=UPI003D14EB23
MKTKRFLLHIHAAEEALWAENREVFQGIACEVASRYAISPDDVELLVVAIRERLWEKLLSIARADSPAHVARLAAYQAATEGAIALLPDDRRIKIAEQRRAKRRRKVSSDAPNGPNSGTTASSSGNA